MNPNEPIAIPDALDELVSRSKDCEELQKFHRAHRANPEVLDFLVAAVRLRIAKGFKAFSFPSLYDYARWKLDVERGPDSSACLNDHHSAFYGRAIMILHPEFNGRAAFRTADADKAFGLRFEPGCKRPDCYARRLEWEDGLPLEKGWRPSKPHVVDPGVVSRYAIR